MLNKTHLFTLALAGVFCTSVPAATFLQILEQTNDTPWVFTNTGTGVSLAVINESVDYKFFIPNALGTGFRTGIYNITATTSTTGTCTGSCNPGDAINENGWSGSGSLYDSATNAIVFTFTFGPTGAGTFQNQQASGGISDAASGLADPEVHFTSSVLDFSISTNRSFAFAFSGGVPGFQLGAGNHLASSNADAVSTFSADPLPGSPEPTSIVLLGSALVGIGLIGRKKLAR
jgi:hypothetical protein